MDRIAIVSAVRDFAFYRKCVEENPMLDGCEKTVFDNRTENMPLPARYNEFLDSFDYSRPAWIVFCHEDWEATEPVAPVLSRLDPGSVYGVAGATVERRAFFFARWKFIGDIESCNRDGSDPGVHGLPAPPGSACDTVDCVCLVVHSSLVQRHSLRFDPEMTFDLYAEDFCIAARELHGVATRLVRLSCRHWSRGCAGKRYRALRKKLQKKWRNAKGCSSTVSPYLCGRAQWWWRLWAALRPVANFVRGKR